MKCTEYNVKVVGRRLNKDLSFGDEVTAKYKVRVFPETDYHTMKITIAPVGHNEPFHVMYPIDRDEVFIAEYGVGIFIKQNILNHVQNDEFVRKAFGAVRWFDDGADIEEVKK